MVNQVDVGTVVSSDIVSGNYITVFLPSTLQIYQLTFRIEKEENIKVYNFFQSLKRKHHPPGFT